MAALDVETMETKEFAKLTDIIGLISAKMFIQKETPELEASYSEYFVEKKRKLDDLKEIPQYEEDTQDIKYIKKAESDRIAPEKGLFELALVCLEAEKNNESVMYITDSKQYLKCKKKSGSDYVKEFINKDSTAWKDHCARFFLLQRQVKAELEANDQYQAAFSRKKGLEDAVLYDLREEEALAKIALVELKSRRVIEVETKEV